ncbi:ROK family transcriptional regulator [Demetria terragena]|uniref:ROK family transcriptional regulator n=1 Tax=Demetria terragena TaxID=63959 RepID=UPI001461393C|nr:ROK family transcriptional regulator [Demetria terragena]
MSAIREGAASQAEIATQIGLNQATVSRVLQPMLDSGLVRSEPMPVQGPGRPARQLRIAHENFSTVGVHLSRFGAHVALTDIGGRRLHQSVHRIDLDSPSSTLQNVASIVRGVIASAPRPVLGVGVTCAGDVDAQEGVIRHSSSLEWRDVEVVEVLSRELGSLVVLDNIARSLIAAEFTFGTLARGSHILVVLVAEAVECAYTLSLNGPLTQARQGDLANLVVPGLQAGTYAPFGDVGVNRAFVAEARRRGLALDNILELQRFADAGNPIAEELVGRRRQQAVAAIRAVSDIVRPEMVFLTGLGISAPVMMDAIREDLEDRYPRDAICPTGRRGYTVESAAACLALRHSLVTGRFTAMKEIP